MGSHYFTFYRLKFHHIWDGWIRTEWTKRQETLLPKPTKYGYLYKARWEWKFFGRFSFSWNKKEKQWSKDNCIAASKEGITHQATGISTRPELIPSMTSCGGWPSTVQPMLWAVPRISFTHPASSFARDFVFIIRAVSTISSRVMFLLFSFLRSRGDSVVMRLDFEYE